MGQWCLKSQGDVFDPIYPLGPTSAGIAGAPGGLWDGVDRRPSVRPAAAGPVARLWPALPGCVGRHTAEGTLDADGAFQGLPRADTTTDSGGREGAN